MTIFVLKKTRQRVENVWETSLSLDWKIQAFCCFRIIFLKHFYLFYSHKWINIRLLCLCSDCEVNEVTELAKDDQLADKLYSETLRALKLKEIIMWTNGEGSSQTRSQLQAFWPSYKHQLKYPTIDKLIDFLFHKSSHQPRLSCLIKVLLFEFFFPFFFHLIVCSWYLFNI